jgi:transcriptional regulator with XRE-family HTH domain
MDSKLIGSNIAKYSRYRIILTTLQQWAKENFDSLNHSLRTKLKSYLDEDAQKTEYRSTSEDMQQRLEALGILIYEILTFIRAKENLLLYRVFHEQYDFADGKVILRDKKQVTFADIAAYTNFSKTTISRYFNHPDSLTLENQEKISQALDTLGYKKNKLAKVLANGKSEFIGIIDYGSVRQFGIRHDKYRYDDVERFSTNLNEQKNKARLIVQVFAQLVSIPNLVLVL